MNLKQILKDNKVQSMIKESWSVSWAMTLIMFFVFLIGLTDVYIAGRFGKEIQAAYGLASQVYFIFSIVAFALTVGSVAILSRLFTANKKVELQEAVDSSLASAIVCGIILGVLGVILSKPFINILNVPPVIKGYSTPLLKIYSIGLLFSYVLLNTNGILRACGMIKKSLWTMGLVCVLNIVFNFILALHTPLGFLGIGIATAISSAVGSILNIIFVRKILQGRLRFSIATVKKIFGIGWPAGLLQILWQLGAMTIFLILSALPKNSIEILAAFTNGIKIESAIFLPAFAFNMANAVIVGNLLGKHNNDNAFQGGIITASIGVVIVAGLTIIVMLNAKIIAAFLSDNQIVIRESIKYIYISLIAEPVMAWGVILAGGLNGAGDTKSVMATVALSIWLVRIPLSYILAIYCGWGAVAVWWSMNISILVQTIFISRRYFGKKWLAIS